METITMTTYDEALAVAKAGGVKNQLPGQTDQDYLFTIVKALAACAPEVWNSLQPTTHNWYDVSVRTHNARQAIPEPEGFKPKIYEAPPTVQVAVAPAAPAAPPVVVLPSLRIQSAVPNIANTPQVITPQVITSQVKTKPEGVIGAIRKTIILNPDWTTRKVHDYLIVNGWPQLKLDVVSVNAGDIRKTVAMVKELNHWKE